MKAQSIEELLKTLERHEGYRQFPYKDSLGIWTVGIGRNLQHNGIDLAEARVMALNDIYRIEGAIKVRWLFYNKLSEARQMVILNMCFQMGVNGVMQFVKMMIACEAGDFKKAAHEMQNSQWYLQTPVRAAELAIAMLNGIS